MAEEKLAAGAPAGRQTETGGRAAADGSSGKHEASAELQSSARRSPVVLGCFDGNGKCNLMAWRKALAKLKSRNDHELQAISAKRGIKHSATLSRKTLLGLLMETEELCELAFAEPPTWKQFEAECKKRLGKHVTFEYDPGPQVATSIHVKDAETMSACMEWLLKQPRPGELRPTQEALPNKSADPSETGECAGKKDANVGDANDMQVKPGTGKIPVEGDKEGGRADDGKSAAERSQGEDGQADKKSGEKPRQEQGSREDCVAVPDIVLPSVLAVELLPSVEEASKVWLDTFDGEAKSADDFLCTIASAMAEVEKDASWKDLIHAVSHKMRELAAGSGPREPADRKAQGPRTDGDKAAAAPEFKVSTAGAGWAALLASAAATPTRHFEVDIYFGLMSRTWTVQDLPRKSTVKRLKVASPWHKCLVCSTSSDNPDVVRPRDATVTLRPHPASADIYVCFTPAPPAADGADGGASVASSCVTLTLRPDADARGSGGAEGEEELRIVINVSWK